jgi:hypothetical protein
VTGQVALVRARLGLRCPFILPATTRVGTAPLCSRYLDAGEHVSGNKHRSSGSDQMTSWHLRLATLIGRRLT